MPISSATLRRSPFSGRAPFQTVQARSRAATVFSEKNFRVEPRVLDLMRQVLRPSLREFRLRFQAAAQVLSRDGPCRGVAFGAGVAMIAIRIDGGLREDRACASALQDQGRAVLLVPHQMNGSPTHEMHQTNSVAQVKYRRSGGERAFVPLQAPKERIEFRGHDRYHV